MLNDIPGDSLPKIRSLQKTVYALIVFLSMLWCSAFFLAPYLAKGGPFSRMVSFMVTLFFSPICHQIPERSFHLWGSPLAVCIRCTSIYVGFFCGVLLLPFFTRYLTDKRQPKLFLVAILPTGTEFILSHYHIYTPGLLIRILSGWLLGCISSFIILPGLFQLIVQHHPKS